MDFDKKVLFENITYLLNEKKIKIGELEANAGVSTGYISRTVKDDKTKPGIDFVVKVSEVLNVSLDTLLKVNLSSLSPTEKYLMSFLEKLISDTQKEKLEWDIESATELNRGETDEDFNPLHPLFTYETFFEPTEVEYPKEVSKVVFVSNSFGYLTYITDNCYRLRLKNNSYVYVMRIEKSAYNIKKEPNPFATEIWMVDSNYRSHYLCDNRSEKNLSLKVDSLYETLTNYSKHPSVKANVRYIIDSFMNNDFTDDEVGSNDLPF